MKVPFRDRYEAGRYLAEMLRHYAGSPNLLVLALPRGGVPVAYEVARALHAPMDIMLVRKLGVPGYEELAMGAIAPGGIRVISNDVIRAMVFRTSLSPWPPPTRSMSWSVVTGPIEGAALLLRSKERL